MENSPIEHFYDMAERDFLEEGLQRIHGPVVPRLVRRHKKELARKDEDEATEYLRRMLDALRPLK